MHIPLTSYCQQRPPALGGFYRVSIKSFPDYKHLLQENYVLLCYKCITC